MPIAAAGGAVSAESPGPFCLGQGDRGARSPFSCSSLLLAVRAPRPRRVGSMREDECPAAGLAVRAGAGRGLDGSEAAQTQGRSALGCGNGRPGCTRMLGRPHAIFAKSPQRDLSETPLSRAPATSHTCQLKLKLIHFKIKLKGGWTASGVRVPAPPPRPIARQAAMAVSFPLSFSVPRASAPCALSSAPPGPHG